MTAIHIFGRALFLAALAVSTLSAAKSTGAIFTTTFDGSIVNENHFESKCAVYLDGGPGPNAPAHAAGLADGDYYFQVTDPSGQTLLSTDPVSNRRFQVSGGVIVAYTGTGGLPHPTGIDQDHAELGAITIQLGNTSCPTDYLTTPNEGGVYKVWATPVDEFVGDPSQVDNPCGGACRHGFVPSKSKSDNFKADDIDQPSFCLTLGKELLEQGIPFPMPAEGWEMSVLDPAGTTNVYFTDFTGFTQVCGLAPGAYTVTEQITPVAMPIAVFVNGQELPFAEPVYSFTWDPAQPEPVIIFRNGGDGGSSF